MMDAAVAEQVIEILAQVAPELNRETLDPAIPFRQQMEFDSVDFLKFVLKLQNRFGFCVPEAHYPRLATLDGCMAYIKEKPVN